jgi:hypothetical protein
MSTLHADLVKVIDSVEILTSTSYRLLGQPVRDLLAAPTVTASPTNLPSSMRAADEADNVPEMTGSEPPETPLIVSDLTDRLYTHLYLRPSDAEQTRHDPLAQRDFVAALSDANTGQGTWEPGWKIGEVDNDGRLAVTRDSVTFWVPPNGLRATDFQVQPGRFCRVRVAKELRNLVPGFYVAIGDGDPEDEIDKSTLVRLYWHLTASAAVPFIGIVSAVLNRRCIPFRTKVLSDPSAYQRADAGVLYLDRRVCHEVYDAISQIYRTISPHLRPETPLFTKQLARGLGLAEDPANGLSFGQHRCQLVAHALWRSFTQGDTDHDARAATLSVAFQQAGLNPLYPYLESHSTDCYTFQSDPTGATLIPSARL